MVTRCATTATITDPDSNVLKLTGPPTFSGFTRGQVKTTTSASTKDSEGNIWETFTNSKKIDPGTISFPVEDDIVDATGGLLANFIAAPGNYVITFPAQGSETTGPKITMSCFGTSYVPNVGILAEGDEERYTSVLTLKISGIPTYTAPVSP